ncbi:hypothetical protein IJH46_00960 [Candidatus Saccharibacteria bacterium]|nr:hypothetical protein [Candidatus Saccharibacteria bacterium]
MKKGISFFIGLGLLAGSLAVPTMPVYAEASPTSCEGLENCVEVASTADLSTAVENSVLNAIVTNNFELTADLYTKASLNLYLGEYTITTNGWSIINDDGDMAIYAGANGKVTETGGVYAPFYIYNNTTLYGGTFETAGPAFYVGYKTGNLTINGGVLNGTSDELATIIVDDGASLTLEDGTITGHTWGVSLFDDTEFTMNGGTVAATNEGSIAISGNGTVDPSNDNYGANAKITINGGTITSGELGIYAPQKDGETVINGGTINALTGVEIRAGSLEINDGATITVPDNTSFDYEANGNGSTTIGAAVVVAQHTTKLPISVNITGGDFEAPVAFNEINPQGNSKEDLEQISISISGGTFTANDGIEYAVYSKDFTNFITGGEYSLIPDENYVAEGYEIYDKGANGPYFVEDEIQLNLPESVYLQIGETFDLENYLTDTAKKYITFSDAMEEETLVASFDGEAWKYTAEAKGTGIASYQLHNHIKEEVDSTIEINVVSPEDLEVAAEDGLDISAEELTTITEKIQEILDNYNSGESEIWVDEEGTVSVNPELVKKAIADGEPLTIRVYSEQAAKEELEENSDELAELLEEGDNVVGAWNINYEIVNANGEKIGDVFKLTEPVILTFEIPEEMRTAPEGYTRKFFAIRYHLDPLQGVEIDRLEATFDGENAIIENDKFSAFVITYQDEQDVTAPDTGTFTKSDDSAIESKVKTSVILVSAVMMLLGARMMSLGFAGVTRAKNLEK